MQWEYYFSSKYDVEKNTQKLIDKYKIELWIRKGYSSWGEELDRKKLRILYGDEKIKLFFAKTGKRGYYITPSGVFPGEAYKPGELKWPFGVDVQSAEDEDTFKEKIERQLYFIENMQKYNWEIPRSEIMDFDPEVGIITRETKSHPGVFEDYTKNWYVLPFSIQTIPDLLFALYGREVPEDPGDIYIFKDISSPPWTMKIFRQPKGFFLIDIDDRLGLFVYTPLEVNSVASKEKFFLTWEEKTWEFDYEHRPTVREAFNEVFGVDLSPEMTREDVVAIAAMFAL